MPTEVATQVADQEPSGFFRVINDTLGSLSKAAEVYSDVRMGSGENAVVPAPATLTPRGTTPGTTSPEVAEAKANGAGPVAGMSPTTKLVIAGAAILAGIALVWVVARRK